MNLSWAFQTPDCRLTLDILDEIAGVYLEINLYVQLTDVRDMARIMLLVHFASRELHA